MPHTLVKMVIKSLKIKNQSYYYWNDIIFIDDFDIKFIKRAKRESRIGIDIYYIGYVVNKLEGKKLFKNKHIHSATYTCKNGY